MSDVCAGIMLLSGAFKAARTNVEINLKYIKDVSYKRKVMEDLVTKASFVARMEKTAVQVMSGLVRDGGK
jgi:formiminotetrahydrofolate cyclodeaminase